MFVVRGVKLLCVIYRNYQSGCREDEGNKDREYLLSKPKTEGGIFPISRYDSRPPTRCGSRASAERNGYRDFERCLTQTLHWCLCPILRYNN